MPPGEKAKTERDRETEREKERYRKKEDLTRPWRPGEGLGVGRKSEREREEASEEGKSGDTVDPRPQGEPREGRELEDLGRWR